MSNDGFWKILSETEKQMKQLTVAELIELLKAMPQDALVFHEGCDCYGEANGVVFDETDKTVLITRNN